VIGASTDSFFSHKAWFSDRQTFPNEIAHPVLADTNHSISRAFEVLKEEAGIAYRASVVVDEQGVVRAHHVNDVQVGRSPAEVLRTVQALKSGGFCPAGRQVRQLGFRRPLMLMPRCSAPLARAGRFQWCQR
jgi:peroxiredoxin (alkyl hydroperoxide reductase subunit C)